MLDGWFAWHVAKQQVDCILVKPIHISLCLRPVNKSVSFSNLLHLLIRAAPVDEDQGALLQPPPEDVLLPVSSLVVRNKSIQHLVCIIVVSRQREPNDCEAEVQRAGISQSVPEVS